MACRQGMTFQIFFPQIVSWQGGGTYSGLEAQFSDGLARPSVLHLICSYRNQFVLLPLFHLKLFHMGFFEHSA